MDILPPESRLLEKNPAIQGPAAGNNRKKLPTLSELVPPVDGDDRTGHIAAGVGGQHQHNPVQILRLAKAPHRVSPFEVAPCRTLQLFFIDSRWKPARRNRVDANIVRG